MLVHHLTSSYFLFIFFNTSSIQVTTYFAIFYEYFDYFWADLWQILVVKVNFVGREEEKVRAFRSWEQTQCRFGKLINAEKTLTEIRREKTAQPLVTMETIRCGAEICVIPHIRAHARNTQTNMARLKGRIKATCRVNLTYCQQGVALAVRR